MSEQDLISQLAKVLEEGFSEEFVISCAKSFGKYSFPDDTLSQARLYLFYLTSVLKVIVSEKPEWSKLVNNFTAEYCIQRSEDIPNKVNLLLCKSNSKVSPENVALAIGILTFYFVRENKKSGEDFLTLFVNVWFHYYRIL